MIYCLKQKVLANSVPAAAVIQGGLVLPILIWCKGCVGCFFVLNIKNQVCFGINI